MEKLLFKAKGQKKSYFVFSAILSIVLLVCGIIVLFLSQAKSEALSVSFATSAGQSLGSGSFGGGYIFKESARSNMLIGGIVAIALSLLTFISVVSANKSYISVYEDHIEGVQCSSLLFTIKKPVNLTYDKIKDVQLISTSKPFNNSKIVIYTDFQKSIISANNVEKAYEIIKTKI